MKCYSVVIMFRRKQQLDGNWIETTSVRASDTWAKDKKTAESSYLKLFKKNEKNCVKIVKITTTEIART